ncbi:MAG TPA: lasso peptide biosynthesis B2 protein [Acidimicrobiales bacterium]|nr:lasso peptide biosynthesis B2 protein [Acidimicrobiales bacterium]
MTRRITRSDLRAALWAYRTLPRLRQQLRTQRVDRIVVPPPPPLPENALRGVGAVLRRRRHTCLERSLLLQAWHSAHGRLHNVVVGVRGSSADFSAHAWLEGHASCHEESFDGLMSIAPSDYSHG